MQESRLGTIVIDPVVRGSRGYAEQAEELVARYEGIDFPAKHQAVLPLLPAAPASVIDIGAGTGRDAAWLAERGYRVVAVEPTEALRSRAIALHPSPAIEWIDDSLPALRRVVAQRRRFDLVMLTAVWMHLDAEERRVAMANVAALVAASRLAGHDAAPRAGAERPHHVRRVGRGNDRARRGARASSRAQRPRRVEPGGESRRRRVVDAARISPRLKGRRRIHPHRRRPAP